MADNFGLKIGLEGEKEFKKCKSCHMIVADDGTEIVKGGKTGIGGQVDHRHSLGSKVSG